MRLIDAENVAKNLSAMKERLGCNAIMIDAMVDGLLNQEQTIDAVPVVRCNDCKHFCGRNDKPGEATAIGYCNRVYDSFMPCAFDFFCADGEE